MKKPVIIRFRRDTEMASGAVYHKGAEFELPSPDVAHNLYGDAIEILRYADGEDYELNLREQAAERKEAADDEEQPATKGAKAEAKD
jgi:hypothetical protein